MSARAATGAGTDLLELARAVLPGGVLGSFALPDELAFVPVEGSGAHLRAADGRVYVDYVLGGGPLILGHAPPEVVETAREQLARGAHFYSYLNEPAVRLAAELVDAIPCAERVRFASSGAEATMYALRYARAHTGRTRVVKLEGAYHGNHDAAMLSSWPKRLGEERGTFDSAGVPEIWADLVSIAAFNDLASVERLFDRHPGEIAAVIVEPYQRFLRPRAGFLEGLRSLCDRDGALLVFDEVVTGFRLAYGGAQERYGVVPDLATYGKIIGGGFPLSAVAGPAAILDRSDPARKGTAAYVYQSGTLNGHPVAAAAGLATLRALRRPGTYERLDALSRRLRDGLDGVLRRTGVPAVTLGEVGMWHVLFTEEEPRTVAEASRADAALLKSFHLELIRRGAFVLPGLRSYVSLAHAEADIDRTVEIAEEALRAALAGRPAG